MPLCCCFESTRLIIGPAHRVNNNSVALPFYPVFSHIHHHIPTVHRNLEHIIHESSTQELVCNAGNPKSPISLFRRRINQSLLNFYLISHDLFPFLLCALTKRPKIFSTLKAKNVCNRPTIIKCLCKED